MSQHYDNSATINVQLISIHAPREGRDLHGLRLLLGRDISIHAPRAGRDPASAGRDHRRSGISIHAPRAGRDIDDLIPYANNAKFQSTHPSRGATWSIYNILFGFHHISIHAPRAGRDKEITSAGHLSARFQSTRPMRGATAADDLTVAVNIISIHAPRAGRDQGV